VTQDKYDLSSPLKMGMLPRPPRIEVPEDSDAFFPPLKAVGKNPATSCAGPPFHLTPFRKPTLFSEEPPPLLPESRYVPKMAGIRPLCIQVGGGHLPFPLFKDFEHGNDCPPLSSSNAGR